MKPISISRFVATASSVVTALSAVPALAVTLSGSVNTAPPAPANLTTEGVLDWTIWGTTATAAVASKVPSNDKAGGTLFGSLSAATTGNVRGGTAPTQTFSYTDGTSPVSETGVTKGIIFDTDLDLLGEGVQFTLAGDPAVERVLKIWASGFEGQGTLTASMVGASNVILLSQIYATTKTPTLFTLNYQPDLAGDLLTVSYVLTTNSAGGNSHVGFQAAAVSAVPEPATGVLLLGGMILLLGSRRRS